MCHIHPRYHQPSHPYQPHSAISPVLWAVNPAAKRENNSFANIKYMACLLVCAADSWGILQGPALVPSAYPGVPVQLSDLYIDTLYRCIFKYAYILHLHTHSYTDI